MVYYVRHTGSEREFVVLDLSRSESLRSELDIMDGFQTGFVLLRFCNGKETDRIPDSRVDDDESSEEERENKQGKNKLIKTTESSICWSEVSLFLNSDLMEAVAVQV